MASITLLNEGDVEEEIFFKSGQRYDFVIKDGDQEVWRWSEGKMFTMATGTVTLEPGEKISYVERLASDNLSTGEYKLVGIVTGSPEYRESRVVLFRNK
ncbi:hypothetical protein AKJ62_04760 [candidate division MSBL1 archaeon SCGC-AAA259D14]|uniref:Intracellular proteinase inhibitor BsuPI domain-containing protein n=2 Tax=candidate division MSBL1 TaxID=215777 RepID=A0A133U382_9EURY|nr:hypothetical protein AKJ62_04760 [candidate division MSBL1 archaeon SCGC-AAA259D14]KXA93731.1 hypothetical protein AKJ66_01275 [candidate division MSBL1 archaeon SCGC-AAA259E22]